jgi:hypothetical protein
LAILGAITKETSLKQSTQNLEVVYTVKLSKAQRIKLLQLGGPEWIRNQIERSTELCSLGENDTGQVCPRRLLEVTGPAGGIGATQG